jgi:hypothetical protein
MCIVEGVMGSLTKMATALLWTAGALMTFAVPAMAQDTAWGGALIGNRPIELSIGGAGVVSWATSGVGIRIRLAIPLDERRSIEIFAGPYHDATTDGVGPGSNCF